MSLQSCERGLAASLRTARSARAGTGRSPGVAPPRQQRSTCGGAELCRTRMHRRAIGSTKGAFQGGGGYLHLAEPRLQGMDGRNSAGHHGTSVLRWADVAKIQMQSFPCLLQQKVLATDQWFLRSAHMALQPFAAAALPVLLTNGYKECPPSRTTCDS